MASHVGDSPMRLSKFLFIAMVALCLVFMPVNAQPGDDVAVEAEGEAVAPGGQGVEGGAEVGESQAAQDIVRSQMATTRGQSRSTTPSKAQKGGKLKIAIIIGVIIVFLALAGVGGYFFLYRPYQVKKKNKEVFEWLKAGLGDLAEIKFEKASGDKFDTAYILPKKAEEPTDRSVLDDWHKKVSKISGCERKGETLVLTYKDQASLATIVKGMGCTTLDDKATLEATTNALGKIIAENIQGAKAKVGVVNGTITLQGVTFKAGNP